MTQKYNEIYQKSIKNREDFWKEISNDIFWYKKPTKILNSQNPPFYKWFEDGVTNTCYNALDLHVDHDQHGDLKRYNKYLLLRLRTTCKTGDSENLKFL